MYGRRKYATKRATVSYRGSRFGSRFGGKVAYRKKSRYTNRMKFATVGFTRDVEKKYSDKGLVGNDVDEQVTGANVNDINNGFMWSSRGWINYDFATPGTGTATTNDLLKNLAQGTTATTRVGNKITPKYIKGSITLSAAKLAGPSSGATNGDMNGEALATASNATAVWQYLRTTFRVVIVKDLQVNSADTKIDWNDVFESGTGSVGETGGVHAELKIANMGRFKILDDRLVKTDAVNPQETIRFMVSGAKIGQVRYNGPSTAALTDRGIYVIWSAYTSGVVSVVQGTNLGMVKPGVTMHSRLCFTDN